MVERVWTSRPAAGPRAFEAEISIARGNALSGSGTPPATPNAAGFLSAYSDQPEPHPGPGTARDDPDAIRETFGGQRGFAQVHAIERLVRSDLEHFKECVEQGVER